MTTAQNVLTLAKTFIGLQEVRSNRTPFGLWYGMNGEPWCAMFVSFCTYFSGMPLPITTEKGYAYCPFGVKWFKEQRRWYTTNPQPGDIVFYSFSRNGVAEHTGIVVSANASGIIAIEGNTSASNQANGGEVQQRSRPFGSILGFGRPAYDGVDIGSIAKGVPPIPGQLINVTNPLFSSPNVLIWKRQMQQRGWVVAEPSNPAFTPGDRELLVKFQKLWHLKQDGILGPMSWVLAWLMPIAAPVIKRGAYGDRVYQVQEALKRAGFAIAVDGAFGAETERIVKQFQSQKGLVANGQVGDETLMRLGLGFAAV